MASHNFEVIEKSHATSVSEIYEATNSRGERRLVEVLGEAGFGPWLDAYKQDIAVLARQRHPCILETLDIGTLPDGTPVVVCERPPGLTLGRWLAQGRLAPTRAALELLADIADALGAAHDVGVSHGALGIDDILLIPDPAHPLGTPKLRGFGHRWLRAAAAFDGAPTMVPGTRVVPAPRREIATDVAALAAIADRLLTPLHRGPRLAAILRSAQLLGDDLRFGTPAALVEAVARSLGDQAPEEITTPHLIVPWGVRHRGVQRVLAMALVTVAAAAAVHVVLASRSRPVATPSVRARPASTPGAAVVARPPAPSPIPEPLAPSARPQRAAGAAISVHGAASASLPHVPHLWRVWSERENRLIFVDDLGAPVPEPAQ
jgi:hypothetical protein